MKRDFSKLVERVRRSSNPEGVGYNKILLSESANVPYSDASEYVKLSMWGVPQEYTLLSEKAADMVIATLKKSHGSEVDFRRQGSTVTNTHIWNENDVDIVQITSKSNTLDREGLERALGTEKNQYDEQELKNLQKRKDSFSPYGGNQTSDLRGLRLKSESALIEAYKDVETKKPKAVCVKMQNPKRNVDVVTAVDYHAVQYMASNQEYKRGIQVYDKDLDRKLPAEYPFWSIKLINDRHIESGRRFKRLIRFLKNVKYDCSQFEGRKLVVSSYDINAICYNIRIDKYQFLHYIELVGVISLELHKLIDDEHYRNTLRSIDGQESIFRGKEAQKVKDLEIMSDFVDELLANLSFQNRLVG